MHNVSRGPKPPPIPWPPHLPRDMAARWRFSVLFFVLCNVDMWSIGDWTEALCNTNRHLIAPMPWDLVACCKCTYTRSPVWLATPVSWKKKTAARMYSFERVSWLEMAKKSLRRDSSSHSAVNFSINESSPGSATQVWPPEQRPRSCHLQEIWTLSE